MSEKAVQDGILKRTSVSAIATFDESQVGGCERKWWFSRVAGLETPPSKSASKGVEVHKQIEHWLKTGEDVLGDVAKPAKKHATPKSPTCEVEKRFDGELVASGVPLLGYIDLVDWGRCEVLDWKTTSARLEATPSGRQLIRTVQMPGYGKWMLDQTREDQVRLTHVYLSTKKPGQSKHSTALFRRDEIESRWGEVEQVVDRMKLVAGAKSVEDVRPNYQACSAYGGCAYRDVCPRSSRLVLADLLGVDMSLMDKLKVQEAKSKLVQEEAMITGSRVQELVPDAPVGSGLITGILPPDAPKSKPELAAEPIVEAVVEKAQEIVAEKKRGRKKKEVELTGDTVLVAAPVAQIKTVKLGRTFNTGNYENVKLEFEADVPPGEGYQDTLRYLVDELERFAKAVSREGVK